MIHLSQAESRAFKAASMHRAKIITFYVNGEPFVPGIRVALIPGKDFHDFHSLLDHLTSRSALHFGVRYIFTLDGHRITSLSDLEHYKSYVISGTNRFFAMPYGKFAKLTSNDASTPALLDSLRVSRVRGLDLVHRGGDWTSQSLNSKEGRIVTIVNREDPSFRAKVFLNLRGVRTFELMLKDLGEAVMLPKARKMFTEQGGEVRSVSQLKKELNERATFYVEGASSSAPLYGRAASLESISFSSNLRSFDDRFSQDLQKGFSSDRNRLPSNSYPEFGHRNFAASKSEQDRSFDIRYKEEEMLENKSQRGVGLKSPIKVSSNILSISSTKSCAMESKVKGERTGKQNKDVSVKGEGNQMLDGPKSAKNFAQNKCEATQNSSTRVSSSPENSESREGGNCCKEESARRRLSSGMELNLPKNLAVQEPEAKDNCDSQVDQNREPEKAMQESNLKFGSREEEQKFLTRVVGKHIGKKVERRRGQKNSEKHREREKVADSQVRTESVRHDRTTRSVKGFTSNLCHGINTPPFNFDLTWIHGYKSSARSKNHTILADGELLFCAASTVIMWNPKANTQRHYTEHDQEIQCLAVNRDRMLIATAQGIVSEKGATFSPSKIRVWEPVKLQTLAVYQNLDSSHSVSGIEFTSKGLLVILSSKDDFNLVLWNWKSDEKIATCNVKTCSDEITRGIVGHPNGDFLALVYGHKHLCLWKLENNELKSHNILATGPPLNSLASINCADFLEDSLVVLGGPNGLASLWLRSDDQASSVPQLGGKLETDPVECLLCLPQKLVVSGHGKALKFWCMVDSEFRLLNSIKIPEEYGEVRSIVCPLQEMPEESNVAIYVATFNSLILINSLMDSSKIQVLISSHQFGLRGLSPFPEPRSSSFFTCALDCTACRWSKCQLVWRVSLSSQLLSIAAHPDRQAIAIGGTDGNVFIVEAETGALVATLPICKEPIVCMSFSPEGKYLAVASHQGIMYLLPVSENGFAYEKVSVLKGPNSILSLQWSKNSAYVLTSVNDNNYQELILWDLPNFRYLTGISSVSEDIQWHDATCSGGEDVRGIWDNHNIGEVVNVCCHISNDGQLLVAGDEEGFVRLFRYPTTDSKSAFFYRRQGSSGVIEAKFLSDGRHIVTTSFDGLIFVWELVDPPNAEAQK